MGIFFMTNISRKSFIDVDGGDNLKVWESFISEITLEWLLGNERDHAFGQLRNTGELGATYVYDITTYSTHLEIVWQHVEYSFNLPSNMVSRILPMELDCKLRPLLCLKSMDEFNRIRQL